MKKNTIKVNGIIFDVLGNCQKTSYKRASNIFSAYGKPSTRKISIWRKIEDICAFFNGYDLAVNSYNCMMFTCSFDFNHGGNKYRMRFTPSHWYQVFRIEK